MAATFTVRRGRLHFMKEPQIQETKTPRGIKAFHYKLRESLTPEAEAFCDVVMRGFAPSTPVDFAHPTNTGGEAVISTYQESAHQVGGSLLRAIRWLCS